ncbi:hypothetical protein LTR53_002494 [Teratosphaeriaceae sp. CCFEE 6253]|nr:hypothetical protein LTR53_002494 [Teratosphaeriaceae sp. CCFEE 6253]
MATDKVMDRHQHSPLFTQLPPELRLRIYEHVVEFTQPIKLRQHIAGSTDMAILRASKLLYREALPVLYDVNTISVTRNDFCLNTDAALRTPIMGQHVRHLRMTSFGESIACNFLPARCSACEDQATGLLQALRLMPQLKTVTVDYSTQPSNFVRFRTSARTSGVTFPCVGVGVYKFRGAGLDKVDFTFQHRPLATIWLALVILSMPDTPEREEEATLARLRKFDASLTDTLWFLFCAQQYGQLHAFGGETSEAWVEEGQLAHWSEAERDLALDKLTTYLAMMRHMFGG